MIIMEGSSPEAASRQLWLMSKSLTVAVPPAEPVLHEAVLMLPRPEADDRVDSKMPWGCCPARVLVH